MIGQDGKLDIVISFALRPSSEVSRVDRCSLTVCCDSKNAVLSIRLCFLPAVLMCFKCEYLDLVEILVFVVVVNSEDLWPECSTKFNSEICC